MADEESSVYLKRRAGAGRAPINVDRQRVHFVDGASHGSDRGGGGNGAGLQGRRSGTTNSPQVPHITHTGSVGDAGLLSGSLTPLSESFTKEHRVHVGAGLHGGSSNNNSRATYHTMMRLMRSLWRRRHQAKKYMLLLCGVGLLVLVVLRLSDVGGGTGSSNTTKAVPTQDLGAEAEAGLADLQDTLIDLAAMGPQEELSGNLSLWSVLVQHEDALARLPLTPEQLACLDAAPPAQVRDGGAAAADDHCEVGGTRVNRLSLPSWTLGTMHASCPDCATRRPAELPAAGQRLFSRHAIVPTSKAPRGLIGPMLYAMSSVTTDVPLREELPRWSWLRHISSGGRPTRSGDTPTGAALRPYLAVMGIPSTDQPARVALRTAQRRTWLSYSEVARSENGFEGALLPLYIFAATEPTVDVVTEAPETTVLEETPSPTPEENEGDGNDDKNADNAEGEAETTTTTEEPTTTTTTKTTESPAHEELLVGRSDLLLPTVREYQQASRIMLKLAAQDPAAAAAAAVAATVEEVNAAESAESFTQRRIVLRADYKTTDLTWSPCRGVVETKISAAMAAQLPLTYLAAELGLNVTPAAVAPAEFICHASAALWQEALTHRNVLWVDMMTDRKPTTKKKLGDITKWGLPVEVGMSQKLILWLEYAYHAFPNVPFIVKGDDDMYLKVPQFLNNVRYVRAGAGMNRTASPPSVAKLPSEHEKALAMAQYRDAVDQQAPEDTKCFYWGSTRRVTNVAFNAGMLFMLHRRLAQVVLEKPTNASDTDLLELAVTGFSKSLSSVYKRTRFGKEDVMIGATLHRRSARVSELCVDQRLYFVRDTRPYFHDLRKGRLHKVTWRTVAAHRCRPADAYFLHFFFQKEQHVARMEISPNEDREEVAKERTAAWIAEARAALPDDVYDWDDLPDVQWSQNVTAGPAYQLAEDDGVAVYNTTYTVYHDQTWTLTVGYRSPLK